MRVEAQRMAADIPARKEAQIKPLTRSPELVTETPKLSREDLKKQQPQTVDLKSLEEAVKTTNDAIKISNYHLEFKVHEESGRYQVKVVDTNTQQVVREIPPENMLDFSAKVKELLDKAVGVLVDETA